MLKNDNNTLKNDKHSFYAFLSCYVGSAGAAVLGITA